jgi:kinesin family protein 15
MQSAVYELQMLQSQMTKLLQEKKDVKECLFQSQETVQDLSSEILQLKSQITDQQKCYEARLKELEIKMQEKDNDVTTSLVSWHKEKEVTLYKAIRLPLRIFFSNLFCGFLNNGLGFS